MTDSAGIEIVTSSAPQWQGGVGWRIIEEPRLRIGVVDGDESYQFHRVTSVKPWLGGSLAVANSGTSEIRVFDEAGRWVRSLGGPGDGPGQLRHISGAHFHDDGVVVIDLVRRLMIEMDTLGGQSASRRLPSFGVLPRGAPAWLDGGGFLLAWLKEIGIQHVGRGAGAGQTVRNRGILVRYSATGEALDSIGPFLASEEALFEHNSRIASSAAPFGRGLAYAAAGDAVYVGLQEDYEVRQYSLDGRLVRMIRWPGEGLALVPGDIERLQERTGIPGLGDTPAPPRKAAYSNLLIDSQGNLWVSEYRFARAWARSWDVFDPSGRWLGPVSVPKEVSRIFAVELPYVFTTAEDALGVEYVQVHRIETGQTDAARD